MTKKMIVVAGCGDVGLRIAKQLKDKAITAIVSSEESRKKIAKHGFETHALNLDAVESDDKESLSFLTSAQSIDLYYLIPPQASGEEDQRSQAFLKALTAGKAQNGVLRIVLISTTGVYGDHAGQWVTEETVAEPQTGRAKRRLSLEQQWLRYVETNKAIMSILRVPGIYSHSRLPRERLEKRLPIVNPAECGYTNRIHADDLAMICTEVMRQQRQTDIYNVSDGVPGKISEYLLEAAKVLGIESPPLISMLEAEQVVSKGMLSYLNESRKISNRKIVESFDIQLKYPDFKQGMLN